MADRTIDDVRAAWGDSSDGRTIEAWLWDEVEEARKQRDEAQRSIPLGELRQVTYVARMATPSELTDQLDAALARVAALEAVLAEPSDEEAERLATVALLAEWEPYVDTRELDIDVPGGLDRYERAVADLRQRAGTPTPRPARVVRQAEGE